MSRQIASATRVRMTIGGSAINQMQPEGAHMLDAEPIRRRAVMTGKSGDGGDIEALRQRRQVAHGHILDHALAQLGLFMGVAPGLSCGAAIEPAEP
jgi:hypothetical protein